jgi:hypothetical protein
MASFFTPAVPVYSAVKSKDTVLPTRAAVRLETDRYAFYFLLLHRMFQSESRPNREHCVLYFSTTSEALNLSGRLQRAAFSNIAGKIKPKDSWHRKNRDRMQSSAD